MILGFKTAAAVPAGMAAVSALGIPLGAVIQETWGEATLTSWGAKHRPTGGGIKIMIANGSRGLRLLDEEKVAYGSHGFNVRTSSGEEYLMMASHIVNSWAGQNGAVNDTVFQPGREWISQDSKGNLWTIPGGPIGVITVNPPWRDTPDWCPGGTDFCTDADVALARILPGVAADRKIGVSNSIGFSGPPGSADFQWESVAGVIEPEFVWCKWNAVYKSGYTSGTTIGQIVQPGRPCMDPARTHRSTPIGWPSLSGQEKVLFLDNIARVAYSGWRVGDSGGPVFWKHMETGRNYALGIMVLGEGGSWDGRTMGCTTGTHCAWYFARWDEIERRLNMGPLTPVTPAGGSGSGWSGGGCLNCACPADQPDCAEQ